MVALVKTITLQASKFGSLSGLQGVSPSGGEVVEYSWSAVGEQVRKMAAYLGSLELTPGSNIAFGAGNSEKILYRLGRGYGWLCSY